MRTFGSFEVKIVKSCLFSICSLLICCYQALPSLADEPLQGRVEDSHEKTKAEMKADFEAKLDQMELQGGAQGNGLQGGVQGGGVSPLQGAAGGYNPLQGSTAAAGGNPLQGGVDGGGRPLNGGVSDDPDLALQVDWDRWRNTLTHAIQAGTINKINVHNDANFVLDPRRNMMVSRFPEGISTQYSCDVLPDGRIINIRMMLSSRYPAYDQAVMQSIMDLQGSPILRYPNGSRRQIVNQQASVYASMNTHFENFHFGDIEHQRR